MNSLERRCRARTGRTRRASWWSSVGDEDESDGTGHDAHRPCGVTVRHSRAHGQIATPTRKRPFSGGAANGRRSGGGRARQVGGSGSSGWFHGLDAHRHSLDATSAVLTRRESQHHATTLREHVFSGRSQGGSVAAGVSVTRGKRLCCQCDLPPHSG